MSSFGEKLKGFLVKPVETFQGQKAGSLGDAYKYYIVLLVIFSILYGIVAIAMDLNFFNTTIATLSQMPGMGWATALTAFGAFAVSFDIFIIYCLFIFYLFWIFVSGLMWHCFVLMFDGKMGYAQTIKAEMYAYTPVLLLGWIPYINILAAIWSMVLMIIGIRELQEMPTDKAVATVLLPVILFLIGIILFGVVIATFISGIFGMMGFL